MRKTAALRAYCTTLRRFAYSFARHSWMQTCPDPAIIKDVIEEEVTDLAYHSCPRTRTQFRFFTTQALWALVFSIWMVVPITSQSSFTSFRISGKYPDGKPRHMPILTFYDKQHMT